MAALPRHMDSPKPWQQAAFGSWERRLAPIRRDSVRSRTWHGGKTIVNVVTVVKLVVASAVDEEGDQIHPRIVEPRIHSTSLGHQGNAEADHDQ